jgi:DNA-directed RNA polymerase subunit RPC12/RpoP
MPTYKCKSCGTQFEQGGWFASLKCPACKTKDYWIVKGAEGQIGRLIVTALLFMLVAAFIFFFISTSLGLFLILIWGVVLIILVPWGVISILRRRVPIHMDAQTKYCCQSGTSNKPDTTFCTNCGAKFSELAPQRRSR